jgi:putative glutamine amidotransferase
MPEPIKPIVGVTCHRVQQPNTSGLPTDYFRLSAQYIRAVRDAGAIPVIVPATLDRVAGAEEILGSIHGLLLSGGTDLPAGAFGGKNPRPGLRDTDADRYDYEAHLVREAYRIGLPLMGICRGHQTIVEALGGNLVLNIALESPKALAHRQDQPRTMPTHWLETVAGSRLSRCLGNRIRVNSFHRQAVNSLPSGLVIGARAEDGLIEAVESENPFVLGLQFHPEWLYEEHSEFLKLFEGFVQQAREYAGRPQ